MRALLAFLAIVATPALATPASDAIGPAVNAARAQAGLPPMAVDPRLDAAAQSYAEDMARTGRFDHVGADGSTQVTRAQASGCGTAYVGEDIAYGMTSAQAAFDGWMGSAQHRANILTGAFGAMGVGNAADRWVIMFADRC